MASFLCTIAYGEKGHEILLEVWLVNTKPVGTTEREEVEEALRQAAASGVAPEGWKVSVLNWSHPRSTKSGGAGNLSDFDSLIRRVDITIEERERPKPRDEAEGGEGGG